MSIPLLFDIELEQAYTESKTLTYTIIPKTEGNLLLDSLVLVDTHTFLDVEPTQKLMSLDIDSPQTVQTTLTVGDTAIPGKYKVLLGAETENVAISKFVTVTILP